MTSGILLVRKSQSSYKINTHVWVIEKLKPQLVGHDIACGARYSQPHVSNKVFVTFGDFNIFLELEKSSLVGQSQMMEPSLKIPLQSNPLHSAWWRKPWHSAWPWLFEIRLLPLQAFFVFSQQLEMAIILNFLPCSWHLTAELNPLTFGSCSFLGAARVTRLAMDIRCDHCASISSQSVKVTPFKSSSRHRAEPMFW